MLQLEQIPERSDMFHIRRLEYRKPGTMRYVQLTGVQNSALQAATCAANKGKPAVLSDILHRLRLTLDPQQLRMVEARLEEMEKVANRNVFVDLVKTIDRNVKDGGKQWIHLINEYAVKGGITLTGADRRYLDWAVEASSR